MSLDDDDLYDGDFDFVDDEFDSELDEADAEADSAVDDEDEAPAKPKKKVREKADAPPPKATKKKAAPKRPASKKRVTEGDEAAAPVRKRRVAAESPEEPTAVEPAPVRRASRTSPRPKKPSMFDDVLGEEPARVPPAAEPGEPKSPISVAPVPRQLPPRDAGDFDEEPFEDDASSSVVEDDADGQGQPAPVANYIVHIYEHRLFKRTIDRPFTPEDGDAFTAEYNRTGRSYGRFAVCLTNDTPPKPELAP